MPPATLAETAQNSELLTALNLINLVTVPRGSEHHGPQPPTFRSGFGYTHWRILRDQTNGVLYFTSFSDLTWAKVSLSAALKNKAPVSEDFRGVKTRQPLVGGMQTYTIPISAAKLGFTAGDASSMF